MDETEVVEEFDSSIFHKVLMAIYLLVPSTYAVIVSEKPSFDFWVILFLHFTTCVLFLLPHFVWIVGRQVLELSIEVYHAGLIGISAVFGYLFLMPGVEHDYYDSTSLFLFTYLPNALAGGVVFGLLCKLIVIVIKPKG